MAGGYMQRRLRLSQWPIARTWTRRVTHSECNGRLAGSEVTGLLLLWLTPGNGNGNNRRSRGRAATAAAAIHSLRAYEAERGREGKGREV